MLSSEIVLQNVMKQFIVFLLFFWVRHFTFDTAPLTKFRFSSEIRHIKRDRMNSNLLTLVSLHSICIYHVCYAHSFHQHKRSSVGHAAMQGRQQITILISSLNWVYFIFCTSRLLYRLRVHLPTHRKQSMNFLLFFLFFLFFIIIICYC